MQIASLLKWSNPLAHRAKHPDPVPNWAEFSADSLSDLMSVYLLKTGFTERKAYETFVRVGPRMGEYLALERDDAYNFFSALPTPASVRSRLENLASLVNGGVDIDWNIPGAVFKPGSSPVVAEQVDGLVGEATRYTWLYNESIMLVYQSSDEEFYCLAVRMAAGSFEVASRFPDRRGEAVRAYLRDVAKTDAAPK